MLMLALPGRAMHQIVLEAVPRPAALPNPPLLEADTLGMATKAAPDAVQLHEAVARITAAQGQA